MNSNSKIIFVTSDPHTGEQAFLELKKHFPQASYLFWEMGNAATKIAARKFLAETDYDMIFSYFNGLIFRDFEIKKARLGSLNIHPAPPEHAGAWGLWSQPVVRRQQRTHHGITVHEIDEQIDHGPIYWVQRWEVLPGATIQEVEDQSGKACLEIVPVIVKKLIQCPNGTKDLKPLDEHWDPTNAHLKKEDIRRWFAELPKDHPAHQERVWFNHPLGIAVPPFFSDLLDSSADLE